MYMYQEKYNLLSKIYRMNNKENTLFHINYEDALAFNNYLYNSDTYNNVDFNSKELCEKLLNYFIENNISYEDQKKIVISAPMIFSCDDFKEQLDFIYKDQNLEGILIIDQDGVLHPYRMKNIDRNIIENSSLIKDIYLNSNIPYKKVYYTKSKIR